MKRYVHKNTCVRRCLAILFIITENRKQLRYLPTGEWMKSGLSYREMVPAVKRNKVLTRAAARMELKDVMVSERSQTQKSANLCVIYMKL